jgi:hypothetical protein
VSVRKKVKARRYGPFEGLMSVVRFTISGRPDWYLWIVGQANGRRIAVADVIHLACEALAREEGITPPPPRK